MSLFDNVSQGEDMVNEPAWHPAIKKSFLYVPTAGIRVAPEILVLELFREIFFENFSESTKERQLGSSLEGKYPDAEAEPSVQDIAIFACRGRKKRNNQSAADNFYAPPYPCNASDAWLRKKSDRVVRDFFLRTIAQSLNSSGDKSGKQIDEAVKIIISALIGTNTKERSERIDILALGFDPLEGCSSEEESRERLRTRLQPDDDLIVAADYKDSLADRITQDFLCLCEIERELPRLEWIDLLKSFLRLSTSIWLLARMRSNVLLRDALLDALHGEPPNDINARLNEEIHNRHKGLLQPTLSPASQVVSQVDRYMIARVELNILVAFVDKYSNEDLSGKQLILGSSAGNDLSIHDLLVYAAAIYRDLGEDDRGSFRAQLTRRVERYRAWVSPRKRGQGKNYDESLRVLRRMSKGDEDGSYLLSPSGDGFIVFPGQKMIKLISYFAEKRVGRNSTFVLSDLERHFDGYGLDFSAVSGSRRKLISALLEQGLLRGSPDAGDSVSVVRPFDHLEGSV